MFLTESERLVFSGFVFYLAKNVLILRRPGAKATVPGIRQQQVRFGAGIANDGGLAVCGQAAWLDAPLMIDPRERRVPQVGGWLELLYGKEGSHGGARAAPSRIARNRAPDRRAGGGDR